MGSFGEELRRAREFKGMTLEDVHYITKINLKTLSAIEEERFDILPEPYIRAFVKAYATAVGMNVPKVISEYSGIAQEAEPENEQEDAESQIERKAPQLSNNYLKLWEKYRSHILYGLGAAVVLTAALILIFAGSADKPKPAVEDSETPANAPVSGIMLTVRADTLLYLMVSIDGGDSLDYYLGIDASRDFAGGERIWMLTSNAGATRLNLNGKNLDKLGGNRVPAHFVVESSGISRIKRFKGLIPGVN